ncbi:hypothetical protein [Nocardioides gilvus]|uniref:hypothetical protein n=1 Tax=Nocardioides gilvus TaxID=1735589 RepID=UPI000D741655|nr:hypothetical protein [Nocardioides gilvus]
MLLLELDRRTSGDMNCLDDGYQFFMYSRVWRVCVVAGVSIGLFRLFFLHPGTTALLVPVAAAYLLVLVRVWHWTFTSESDEPTTPPPAPRAIFVGTLIGFGVIGLVHLDALLGLTLLVVGTLTSPGLLRRLTGSCWIATDAPAADEGHEVRSQLDAGLAALDDKELCRRWRESYVELAVADPDRRWLVAQLRAAYLDEMTRRHPRAMSAWLADGCRAWASPEAYFKDSA